MDVKSGDLWPARCLRVWMWTVFFLSHFYYVGFLWAYNFEKLSYIFCFISLNRNASILSTYTFLPSISVTTRFFLSLLSLALSSFRLYNIGWMCCVNLHTLYIKHINAPHRLRIKRWWRNCLIGFEFFFAHHLCLPRVCFCCVAFVTLTNFCRAASFPTYDCWCSVALHSINRFYIFI